MICFACDNVMPRRMYPAMTLSKFTLPQRWDDPVRVFCKHFLRQRGFVAHDGGIDDQVGVCDDHSRPSLIIFSISSAVMT